MVFIEKNKSEMSGVSSTHQLQKTESIIQEIERTGSVPDEINLKMDGYFGFYKNTLLLECISFNKSFLAMCLIQYLSKKNSFDSLALHDQFRGAHNTALILSAKNANNSVALTLLSLPAANDFLDLVDSKGNTALHYACLMRNMSLVEALESSGANFSVRNRFGMLPEDYLTLDIGKDDLNYPYSSKTSKGTSLGFLADVSDFGGAFKGTQNIHFSDLRWFIHLVILNLIESTLPMSLSRDIGLQYVHVLQRSQYAHVARYAFSEGGLKSILKFHEENRKPLFDENIYSQCMAIFKDYHQHQSDHVLKFLQRAEKLDGWSQKVFFEKYFS